MLDCPELVTEQYLFPLDHPWADQKG